MAIVREQLQCFDMSQSYYPNVSYNRVDTTNVYRKERPYRIFRHPGESSATISFGLSGAKNVTKIILELNHCITTGHGVFDIIVNSSVVEHNVQAPRDDFGKECFELTAGLFKSDGNEVQIRLGDPSPGVYWLSDASVYVERRVYQSGMPSHVCVSS